MKLIQVFKKKTCFTCSPIKWVLLFFLYKLIAWNSKPMDWKFMKSPFGMREGGVVVYWTQSVNLTGGAMTRPNNQSQLHQSEMMFMNIDHCIRFEILIRLKHKSNTWDIWHSSNCFSNKWNDLYMTWILIGDVGIGCFGLLWFLQ